MSLSESALELSEASYRKVIPAGEGWMGEVKKGQFFRIVDLEGNQAADTLFYNAEDYADRYSAADTIREQGSIYLTTGTKLRTIQNHVLMEIVADTCGRHDTLGGACAAESNQVRYSVGKHFMHSCRDTFLREGLKWEGRGGDFSKRDITNNINFFMNVPVTAEGGLTFEDGISAPGRYVEMRAEMDTVVLISNCPQLNNPCNAYNPTPVEVCIWDGLSTGGSCV